MKNYTSVSNQLAKGAPRLIAVFFMVFVALALFGLFTYRTQIQKTVLQSDIEQLATIFAQIDKTAGILSFDHDHNWINFLHVHAGGFSGSELGSLNLKHPDKWEGPYLEDNPTYQGIEYQVVVARDGLYVMPGPGVTLPNGNVIGANIIINPDVDVKPLLEPGGILVHKGIPFAAPIDRSSRKQREILVTKALDETYA